jgi:hypothetical protein
LASGASALKSLTVVVGRIGAISRESVAVAGQRTYIGVGLESQTLGAAVPSSAAARNRDTGLLELAPSLSGGTGALKGLTVVIAGA